MITYLVFEGIEPYLEGGERGYMIVARNLADAVHDAVEGQAMYGTTLFITTEHGKVLAKVETRV